MNDFGGHITRVLRDSAEPLSAADAGVLRILPNPIFSVHNRDIVAAEYYTADGRYGQVCKELRLPGYYARGEWLPGKVSTSPRHASVEAAVTAALAELPAGKRRAGIDG
ncbi:hypothetical protein [Nonomuraea aridisoli]|uniref:Uncharacterized protein n=1 Tax=Nonomuraea aridisoli TaxID=2070368 RepID=A0A2W2EHT4_9ACTN|nr:hypothetical protein [Nonomuraea aridisoli]PZG04324.1 hypothetical protein C1J01_44795 [Nonomuraea aridisoli]